MAAPDLIVLFEHPQWQKPLLEVLERRGVSHCTYDLKGATVADWDVVEPKLFFNQASPSAYTRGNDRAVPFALEFIDFLEGSGARVLNGSRAFRLELSKFAQVRLMKRLGIPYPRTVIFNHPAALSAHGAALEFPAILKPNQGGSGARMHRVDSIEEVQSLLDADPSLWLPDNVLLIQEYLPHDPQSDGVVRMEFLGDDLLYAMRIRSAGGFNLCPSEVCNPVDGEAGGACAVPDDDAPTFEPFPDVPAEAVRMGKRIMAEGGLDVGGIEYLETTDGRRVFYDVNANSNLRRPIGEAFGFDPFERVAEFLERELARLKDT